MSLQKKLLVVAGLVLGGALLWNKVEELRQGEHSALVGRRLKQEFLAPAPSLFPQYVENKQRLWLFVHRWTVPQPRGLVFVCHGYGEHAGRYAHVAQLLNKHGYSVYAIDHQGHGQSEGDRAFVEKFDHYVDDFVHFVEHIRGEVSEQLQTDELPPMFLVGHSMGGLISTHVLMRPGLTWRGTVLSGAALALSPDAASPTKRYLARLFSEHVPRLPLGGPIGAGAVSREPLTVYRYAHDPLVYHGSLLARFGGEFLGAVDRAREGLGTIAEVNPGMGLLIMHGGEDKLVDVSASHIIDENTAGVQDKTLKIWDNLYHEIFNEIERDEVLCVVVDWINERA